MSSPVAASVSNSTASTGSNIAVQHGERDGEQIHQQNERPDDERDFRERENRNEHERECEDRKDVIRPCLGCHTAPALEQRGQSRVDNGEEEIKRQRGVEQFVGQRSFRPKSE